MKTFARLTFYALFISLASSCWGQQLTNSVTTPAGAAERERVAADIASNFAKKDYAAVRKDFAKIMLDALSTEKLKDTWEGLVTKIGEFQKVISTNEVQIDGYTVIKKRCQFANENATIQVTFNDENKVIGLYLKL